MDIFYYAETHSKEQMKTVCELVNTKLVWLRHLSGGHGKVSLDLAVKLEAATRALAVSEDDCITVNDIFGINNRIEHLTTEYKNKLQQEKNVA